MHNTDPQIIPMLSYENGVEAMQWLCKAFGFTEKEKWLDDTGRLMHGELVLGTGLIMLASPTPDYQSPKHHRESCPSAAKWSRSVFIIDGTLVYVDNVPAHFKIAKAAGATILSEIESDDIGTRYRAEDPEGHRWMFMQR